MTLLIFKKIILGHYFSNLTLANEQCLRFPKKNQKWSRMIKKGPQKVNITNTFDFSSQKPK